jgi:CBS domain containing-hemolysin-like protein
MQLVKKFKDYLKSYISWNNIFFNKNNIQDYTYEKLLELILLYDKYKNNNSISEHYLFKNIITLRDKQVQDIMIPRVDIVAIEENWELDEILQLMTSSGYSRLPVYEDNLDNLLGFLHIKDLIPIIKKKGVLNIKNILRQVIFISPYMKLFDLLYEMKVKRVHMAIVVDEFGGIDGLITIEDVMEEIVGDITDEHDKIPHEMLVPMPNSTIEADARVSLEEVEQVLGNIFSKEEKEECNTLSGLLVFLVGYIPSKNEVIRHKSGIEFKVLSVDPLKINKVCIYGYTK